MTAGSYRERASALPGAVLWCGSNPVDGRQTVLPDGCMDLLYFEGRLLVAGPDTRAHEVDAGSGPEPMAIRFAPGQAPRVLGIDAVRLRDSQIDLDQLWSDRAVRRVRDRIEREGALGLEAVVRERFTGSDPLVLAVLRGLRRGAGIDAIADSVGLGPRQLHRRCTRMFGYGPKTLDRILRMHRALELLRNGTPQAEAASMAGYADQAHGSREIRALTGISPSRLVG